MKRILIIDGQGGGMGAQLAKLLLPKLPADCELLAVGTNVLATSAMLKAGAVRGATGENAVIRSEERRVGKECLRLCRSRWSPYH